MALLKEKHPEPTSLSYDDVINVTHEEVYPVAFDRIYVDDVSKQQAQSGRWSRR